MSILNKVGLIKNRNFTDSVLENCNISTNFARQKASFVNPRDLSNLTFEASASQPCNVQKLNNSPFTLVPISTDFSTQNDAFSMGKSDTDTNHNLMVSSLSKRDFDALQSTERHSSAKKCENGT